MDNGSLLCVNVNLNLRADIKLGISHKYCNLHISCIAHVLFIAGYFIIHCCLNQMANTKVQVDKQKPLAQPLCTTCTIEIIVRA